jgi:hypothetical protein
MAAVKPPTYLTGEPTPEEALKFIAKADEMIERFHDLDYVLKSEARTLPLMIPEEKKPSTVLSDWMVDCFGLYAEVKSKYPSQTDPKQISMRYTAAWSCMHVIDRALTYGVVEEGQGLARKLRECQTRVTELENDLHKLAEEYRVLQTNFEDYQRRVRPFGERGEQ